MGYGVFVGLHIQTSKKWGDEMDPYKAESMGIPYEEFRKLQDLANEDDYVDPYQADSRGVQYKNWSKWERDRERRH